ncbi:hypothetical protein [Thauera aminoaromatica]|uniref:hypothetical protein n=1 Tax=Thauera aminoaromatica TaxID=164330 RepID=UPI0035AFA60D
MLPFSWMWQDPALVVDDIRALRQGVAAEEKRLAEQERRRKARRIRKLVRMAKAGKLKGVA